MHQVREVKDQPPWRNSKVQKIYGLLKSWRKMSHRSLKSQIRRSSLMLVTTEDNQSHSIWVSLKSVQKANSSNEFVVLQDQDQLANQTTLTRKIITLMLLMKLLIKLSKRIGRIKKVRRWRTKTRVTTATSSACKTVIQAPAKEYKIKGVI